MTPWAARILDWMTDFCDRGSGLLGYPSEAGSPSNPYQQPGVPLVRETASFAAGLLMRDLEGDRELAARSLRAVLAHQIDRPGSVVHGTFRRSPIEPEPGDEPREWIDYDPNWREFIGSTFALILGGYEERLPEELVREIDHALRLAVEGTRARRVSAEYTNIALMCAFLLDWTGKRLAEPVWRDEAVALAEAVRSGYLATGAFPEHNSPTYYGIDLYGLALWRARAPSERLRVWGAELEAALWRDLARFHHAGLGNQCGPYTRAYGMDMRRYVASLGLWIAAAIPDHDAPLPGCGPAVDHAHDFCKAPLVDELGSQPPPEVCEALMTFQGERVVEQVITDAPRRTATAWLSDDLMLGGEYTSGRFIHWQHHPATVHWRRPDGQIGWIRLVTPAPVDAVATPGQLTITVHCGQRWLRGAEVAIWLEVETGDSQLAIDVSSSVWHLPGIALRVEVGPDAGLPEIRPGDAGPPRVGWVFTPGTAPRQLHLSLDVAFAAP